MISTVKKQTFLGLVSYRWMIPLLHIVMFLASDPELEGEIAARFTYFLLTCS